jgi:hypothetical protein
MDISSSVIAIDASTQPDTRQYRQFGNLDG